jgi:hypothetical protein
LENTELHFLIFAPSTASVKRRRLRRLHRGQRQPRRHRARSPDDPQTRHLRRFSVLNDPSTINWTIIGDTKELTIHGSHLGPSCYPKVIDALATGKVDVKPLLADAYPIAKFDRAMQASLGGGVLKNLNMPWRACYWLSLRCWLASS